MRKNIERFIDSFTMYRFVLIGLYIIAAFALVLSLLGELPYVPLALALSYGVVMLASWGVNKIGSSIVGIKPNPESWHITALILFLLVFPQQDVMGLLQLTIIATIAMLSKYIFVYRGRHIFNPAAIAVVVTSALGLLGASWWVGTLYLLPVVLIIGGLIVWKLRLFAMVSVYVLSVVSVSVVRGFVDGAGLGDMLNAVVLSSPLVFLASIMLTEPLTIPPSKRMQAVYAASIGILQGLGLGWLSKPDVALSIGAFGSFFLSIRHTARLRIVATRRVSGSIYETTFAPERRFAFKPGQYLEISVPHHNHDLRGTRRVFSLASSPQRQHLRLAYSVPEQASSSFKRALVSSPAGTIVHAHRVGGDFTLPKGDRPLVFIAGGIGVTPFLSMLESMATTGDERRVTLFYAARNEDNLAYADELRQLSTRLNLEFVPVVDTPLGEWTGLRGKLSYEMLVQYGTTMNQSIVYISGPISMVRALKHDILAHEIVDIRTDYFSGL